MMQASMEMYSWIYTQASRPGMLVFFALSSIGLLCTQAGRTLLQAVVVIPCCLRMHMQAWCICKGPYGEAAAYTSHAAGIAAAP
jgi:hypothetical protein